MIHVYPLNDKFKHNLDEDTTCDCGTRIEYSNEGEMIVIHELVNEQIEGEPIEIQIDWKYK